MGPGGGVIGPVVLPLGLGTGGLFLATVSTVPNRKAITIKKIFTIVFILVLKKQREILLYNSKVINRYYKVKWFINEKQLNHRLYTNLNDKVHFCRFFKKPSK